MTRWRWPKHYGTKSTRTHHKTNTHIESKLVKSTQLAALVLLGAIWGASFLFIRVAAPVLGPLFLMDVRVLLAGSLLLLLAVARRQPPRLWHRWREYLLLGTMNAAIPFALIAFSQLTLTASLAAILNSTTPLFTAIVASVWLGQRLRPRQIVGVVLGIVGVAVLVGGSPLTLDWETIRAALASLGAAFSYGLGTVYASKNFSGLKPMHTAVGQLFGAGAVLFIPALLTLPQTPPTPDAIAALLALTFVSTSFAYLLYFYLINHVGPTRTSTVTFLVPLFGTIWGVIFLNEAFSMGMILGLILILMSVSLVLGITLRKASQL